MQRKLSTLFIVITLFGAGCSSTERADHSIPDLDSALIDPPSTIDETGTIGINDAISDRIQLLRDSVFSLLPQTQLTDYHLAKLSLLSPKTQSIQSILSLFPIEDLPNRRELNSCKASSFEYYYGGDHLIDYNKARCAAFREFSTGIRRYPHYVLNDDLNGADILSMLYANGLDVKENRNLGILMAIESSGSYSGVYEYQDDLSGGYLNDLLMNDIEIFDILSSRTSAPLSSNYNILERTGVEDLQPQFLWELKMDSLVGVDGYLRWMIDEFTDSVLKNETYASGSGALYYSYLPAKWFLNHFHSLSFEFFESGQYPVYNQEEVQQIENQLKLTLLKLIQDPYKLSDNRVININETQPIWTRYRDSWIEYGQQRYPHVTEDSWIGWLTTWRIKQLVGPVCTYRSIPEGDVYRHHYKENLKSEIQLSFVFNPTNICDPS